MTVLEFIVLLLLFTGCGVLLYRAEKAIRLLIEVVTQNQRTLSLAISDARTSDANQHLVLSRQLDSMCEYLTRQVVAAGVPKEATRVAPCSLCKRAVHKYILQDGRIVCSDCSRKVEVAAG